MSNCKGCNQDDYPCCYNGKCEHEPNMKGIGQCVCCGAEMFEERFSVGDKVTFFDEDDHETFIGNIDWMIITETGDVEVSIADTPLGRVDLESLEHVK